MVKNTLSEKLKSCSLCPRECFANRTESKSGYCKLDDQIYISSICIHRGEEPPINGSKGICNVFFAHCNLQCSYCQNFQISDNKTGINEFRVSLEEAVDRIEYILNTGIPNLGFVSPGHQIPQMLMIIKELNQRYLYPIIVYNSNGYDSAKTLKFLDGIVDVYLPDFKYSDDKLAKYLSDTSNYSEIALKAIKEMYRQKGSTLITNEDGYAESGLIIRHLVLPGYTENSIGVLNIIADEISQNVNISLMSQYYPPKERLDLLKSDSKVSESEYELILNHMEKISLNKGWIQEYDSNNNYIPDFTKSHPFEN